MGTLMGERAPEGPGGRGCRCCGRAPGIKRKRARRVLKRRERHSVAREIRLHR